MFNSVLPIYLMKNIIYFLIFKFVVFSNYPISLPPPVVVSRSRKYGNHRRANRLDRYRAHNWRRRTNKSPYIYRDDEFGFTLFDIFEVTPMVPLCARVFCKVRRSFPRRRMGRTVVSTNFCRFFVAAFQRTFSITTPRNTCSYTKPRARHDTTTIRHGTRDE